MKNQRALIVGWRFDYSGWVGYWGGPDIIPMYNVYAASMTEGECSRKIFKTAKAARAYLARVYGIPADTIPIQRNCDDWNKVVEKAMVLQGIKG